MSNETAKYINSHRRHKNDVAVARQVRIAKQHGLGFYDKAIKEPHRLVKHHAMDCGIPKCPLCSNPRRSHKDKLTTQEKRLFQNVEKTTDKHSNGLAIKDQED